MFFVTFLGAFKLLLDCPVNKIRVFVGLKWLSTKSLQKLEGNLGISGNRCCEYSPFLRLLKRSSMSRVFGVYSGPRPRLQRLMNAISFSCPEFVEEFFLPYIFRIKGRRTPEV